MCVLRLNFCCFWVSPVVWNPGSWLHTYQAISQNPRLCVLVHTLVIQMMIPPTLLILIALPPAEGPAPSQNWQTCCIPSAAKQFQAPQILKNPFYLSPMSPPALMLVMGSMNSITRQCSGLSDISGHLAPQVCSQLLPAPLPAHSQEEEWLLLHPPVVKGGLHTGRSPLNGHLWAHFGSTL